MSNDAATGPGTPGDEGAGERLAGRLAHQWLRRAEPRAQVAIETGPSNFAPAQVPWGLDLAASLALVAVLIPMANRAPAVAGVVVTGVLSVLTVGMPMKLGLLVSVIAGVAVAVAASAWAGREGDASA